jgi:hypothetical protein
LSKSQQDFSVLLQLPEGTNRLKFIVDGEWKCSNDLDSALDPTGNLVNYLEVVRMSTSALLASSDGSSSGGERHVPSLSPLHQQQSSVAALYEYSQIIPDYLMPRSSTTIAKADPNFSDNSPSNANESSCGKRRNVQSKQGSNPLRELPPALPPQLNRIILNTRPSVARQQSSSGQRQKIDPNALSVPDHVCLNHVYALSIRDDVMGLATTFRYRNKYSTVILYRPTDCSTFT